MYGFETLMQVEQIGKRLSRFGVVFGKQGFHFAPHIFRCGGFVTAYLIGQAFVFPDGEPLLAAVRCSRFEYCVQLFDKRFGNPLLGTIDNEVDATEMICRLYDIVCTHALALDSVNNEKSSQHQCCEDFA